jgi:integrase
MKRQWHGYTSPLAAAFEHFLAYKRALGRRFQVEESVLRLFDRFLVEQSILRLDTITAHVIESFLGSRPRVRPRSYNHLRGTLVRFFEWAVAQGYVSVSPVQAPPRRVSGHRVPFIFDAPTARRLLEIAKALPDNAWAPCRGQTYYTIFAVLYGLGLRVGEVSRLTISDVDLARRLLVIRETKFGKTRWVPFGPRIASLLMAYRVAAEARRGPLSADMPFFSFTRRGAIHPCTITQTFHHLVPRLHLVIPDGVASPRLHDLRHSFAVGTLLRWYRTGVDPQTRLLHLSTFLGHVDPASTAVYLTITPALLAAASERFARYAASSTEGGTP